MQDDDFGDQTHPEDVGSIQSFPVLERDLDGKLTPDSQAAIAIAGMLPGPVADKAERLEAAYQAVRVIPAIEVKIDFPLPISDDLLERLGLWLTRSLLRKYLVERVAVIAHKVIGDTAQDLVDRIKLQIAILRREVALLALNYQESQNSLKQMQVQRAFYDQFIKLQEQNTKFRAFLYENFQEELKVADATNMPLIQFAQGLMLQLKMPRSPCFTKRE